MIARYGWTLDQVRALDCGSHARLQGAAESNTREEGRTMLMGPAFSFWLEHVSGGSKRMTFERFCEKLGLIEPPTEHRAIKARQAEEAIKRAEQIRQADKR